MLSIKFKEEDEVIVISGLQPAGKNLLGKAGTITKIQLNGMIEVGFDEHLSALYDNKWYFNPYDLVKKETQTSMQDLTIRRLCAIGRRRLDKAKAKIEEDRQQMEEAAQQEKKRAMARKWRSLVGEAQYDLGEEISKYVNWDKPKQYDAIDKIFAIKDHAFTILIPNFTPIEVNYRYISGQDWIFDSWNILSKVREAYSGNLKDLPIVLELARVEGLVHKKQKVKIEEINSDLEEGTVKKPLVGPTVDESEEAWSYGPGCPGLA